MLLLKILIGICLKSDNKPATFVHESLVAASKAVPFKEFFEMVSRLDAPQLFSRMNMTAELASGLL